MKTTQNQSNKAVALKLAHLLFKAKKALSSATGKPVEPFGKFVAYAYKMLRNRALFASVYKQLDKTCWAMLSSAKVSANDFNA